MFAVVQIGSSTRRSACITAFTVRAAEACAFARMIDGPGCERGRRKAAGQNIAPRGLHDPLRLCLARPLHELGHADAERVK